jgi:pimeloyl-ACP methyl ester carboxylesterase
MPYSTASDGAQLFYKDWGTGQPVVFSHGWPLNADAWDVELKLVADRGFRAIAHDRRGHGRSAQTWNGNDMDAYAADLAALTPPVSADILSATRGATETGWWAGESADGPQLTDAATDWIETIANSEDPTPIV